MEETITIRVIVNEHVLNKSHVKDIPCSYVIMKNIILNDQPEQLH